MRLCPSALNSCGRRATELQGEGELTMRRDQNAGHGDQNAEPTKLILIILALTAGLVIGTHGFAQAQDSDSNPPGPRGGAGTDWENPPGPRGGPGTSPDSRPWVLDPDNNPPGPPGRTGHQLGEPSGTAWWPWRLAGPEALGA